MYIKREKGQGIKTAMSEWKYYANQLERAELFEQWERVDELNQIKEKHQQDYDAYMESLPQRFSKAYTIVDYRADLANVKQYYTKWDREDFYDSKGSLKRIKQYEKREGLEHYLIAEHKEKKRKQLARETYKYTNGQQGSLI